MTNRKTILIVTIVIAIGAVSIGLVIDTAMKYNAGKGEMPIAITAEEQIATLQAMTCDEFYERNSNGVDYINGDVRQAAKEIREACQD